MKTGSSDVSHFKNEIKKKKKSIKMVQLTQILPYTSLAGRALDEIHRDVL